MNILSPAANYSTLSEEQKTFIDYLTTVSTSITVSVALAKLLSDEATLPSGSLTSDIENPSNGVGIVSLSKTTLLLNYFRATCEIPLKETLYKINEYVLLNIDEIVNLAFIFYKIRYNVLYNDGLLINYDKNRKVVDFFKIGFDLSDEVIKVIEDQHRDIFKIYNDSKKVFCSKG